MKKLLVLMLFLLSPVYASDKLHVKALTDFSSASPQKNFTVQVIEDGEMNDIPLFKGDILNCTLEKIKDPKRAKMDAKIYLKIDSYEDSKGVHNIDEFLIGKYAKKVLNKEEIKKTPPKKIVKKTAGVVGGYFIKGFSYGVSFVDGAVENKDGNRLKSGAKQVYDDSFLSLVEFGHEVEIKTDDTFYLVVKRAKDNKDETTEETEEPQEKEDIKD